MNKIRIICECNSEHFVEGGTSLAEIFELIPQKLTVKKPIAAYVNNRIKELTFRVFSPSTIRFVDQSSFAGMRVYQRTASFVLQCAVEELLPKTTLHIRHSIGSNGLYCEIESDNEIKSLEAEDVKNIEQKMREIVDADNPIICQKLPTEEVRRLYEDRAMKDKLALLETRPRLYSELYTLRATVGYLYGSLAPSTSYVDNFSIAPYHKGFTVRLPQINDLLSLTNLPTQDKMYDVFQLYRRFVDVMGVQTVGALNAKVLSGDASEMIKLSEAVSDRGIISVADDVAKAYRERKCRICLIAGPSSSGKTTTAKRLGVQLQILGFSPVLISLDDYFVDREHTPLDENGEYDYEALEAIDLKLFNKHLDQLLEGKSVDMPRYDFIKGISTVHEKPLTLSPNSILIIEGIHGLNPKLIENSHRDNLFRIYASCFTPIAMDNISRISTSDNRLLRRLTRDFAQRGNSALQTLQRWQSVRRGEHKHIFPYQENADRMLNTAHFYEIAVLKPFAQKILREVPNTVPEFEEAHRMLKFLDQFITIDSSEISPTSVLREFIGGGSFN